MRWMDSRKFPSANSPAWSLRCIHHGEGTDGCAFLTVFRQPWRVPDADAGSPGWSQRCRQHCRRHLVYGLGDSPAEAEADHDCNLRALLGRAQERDLKLNPTKIQFKLVQLKFMGHHVSEDGVSPDPAKVDAILQFPQPTNKPALQRFLGMANYLNAFCPNLSSVIHPLFQLTRKDADFQWSSVHTSAFEAARKLIADAPCLAFFDQHKPVTLQGWRIWLRIGRCSYASRLVWETSTGCLHVVSAETQRSPVGPNWKRSSRHLCCMHKMGSLAVWKGGHCPLRSSGVGNHLQKASCESPETSAAYHVPAAALHDQRHLSQRNPSGASWHALQSTIEREQWRLSD